jgi:hypothetical protein
LRNADQHFGIFVFPRKSFSFVKFTDQASWLVLAPETLFWRLTGTIAGTIFGRGAIDIRGLATPRGDVHGVRSATRTNNWNGRSRIGTMKSYAA